MGKWINGSGLDCRPTQTVKVGDKISCQRFINRGIVQGSGVGPLDQHFMLSWRVI